MKVGYFVPPKLQKGNFDQSKIEEYFGVDNVQYAYKGRYALRRILKAWDVKKIAIPAYLCDSVVLALNDFAEFYFYDINEDDLNPSLTSLVNLYKKNSNIEAVLVPSLYGNPADLVSFQDFCRKNDILMIDDAAQAFGASIDGTNIGGFGDAGFFSFSPGKPTAGYAGSFYWQNNRLGMKKLPRTQAFGHFIDYVDYRINREWEYSINPFKIFGPGISLAKRVMWKLYNPGNDNPAKWENQFFLPILDYQQKTVKLRRNLLMDFSQRVQDIPGIRIVSNLRGIASPCKIVIVFSSIILKNIIQNQLYKNKIRSGTGYKRLPLNCLEPAKTKDLRKRIIELPIELNADRYNYILSTFLEIIENNIYL